jgi:hypothetical protein
VKGPPVLPSISSQSRELNGRLWDLDFKNICHSFISALLNIEMKENCPICRFSNPLNLFSTGPIRDCINKCKKGKYLVVKKRLDSGWIRKNTEVFIPYGSALNMRYIN